MDNFDFTYCPIDLDLTDNDINLMKSEILPYAAKDWPFAGVHKTLRFFPIFKDGATWTKRSDNFPNTKRIMMEKVLRLFPSLHRVQVLKTDPGTKLEDHCDCKIEQLAVNSTRLGFRIALHGDVENFYFLDESNNRVHVPPTSRSYIINVCHQHGCEISNDYKITLALPMFKGNDIVYDNAIKEELNKNIDRLDIDNLLRIKPPKYVSSREGMFINVEDLRKG